MNEARHEQSKANTKESTTCTSRMIDMGWLFDPVNAAKYPQNVSMRNQKPFPKTSAKLAGTNQVSDWNFQNRPFIADSVVSRQLSQSATLNVYSSAFAGTLTATSDKRSQVDVRSVVAQVVIRVPLFWLVERHCKREILAPDGVCQFTDT
jgi:hypothetical protein